MPLFLRLFRQSPHIIEVQGISLLAIDEVYKTEIARIVSHHKAKHNLQSANSIFFYQPSEEKESEKSVVKRDFKLAFQLYSSITEEFKTEYGEAQYQIALIICYHSNFTPENFDKESV